MLHPDRYHNGECADGQKTATVVIVDGALCVGAGAGEYVLVKGEWRSWCGEGGVLPAAH